MTASNFLRDDATFTALVAGDVPDLSAIYIPVPGAWTTYIPTLTPNTGSITTGGSAGFLKFGKLVFVNIAAKITAISGSPASVTIALPVAPLRDITLVGVESVNSSKTIQAEVASGATTSISIIDTVPSVRAPLLNDEYRFTGSYEAA